MLKIGLTGGIGSGKSVAANLFAGLDIPVIDTDIISRNIVEPGMPAYSDILKLFGPDCIDDNGYLKRNYIRDIIFSDSEKKRELENILHPLIKKEMLDAIEVLDSPYCILVIPLLLETNQEILVDRILVVDAIEESRRQRIAERDHFDDSKITAIMQQQASRDMRLRAADDIITNDGSIEELESQVSLLHEKYLKLARSSHHHPL